MSESLRTFRSTPSLGVRHTSRDVGTDSLAELTAQRARPRLMERKLSKVGAAASTWLRPVVSAASKCILLSALSSASCLAITTPACTPQRGTIGAILARQDEGRLFVRKVPAHLGGAKAGLQPGDEILLIEGQDVRSLGASQVHDVLSGRPGEPLRLTILRGDEIVRLSVIRTAAPDSPAQTLAR